MALQEVGLHGSEQRGDRDAGEDERRRPGWTPTPQAQAGGGQHGEHCTGERGGRQREPAASARAARDDRQRRTEPGTGCDPEQVRVGQRVAEHALVGGARAAEQCTDCEAEHDAWGSQLEENGAFGRAQPVLEREHREPVRECGQHA